MRGRQPMGQALSEDGCDTEAPGAANDDLSCTELGLGWGGEGKGERRARRSDKESRLRQRAGWLRRLRRRKWSRGRRAPARVGRSLAAGLAASRTRSLTNEQGGPA